MDREGSREAVTLQRIHSIFFYRTVEMFGPGGQEMFWDPLHLS
jgi:hypothetical protein